ncbi:CRISPR-associated endonuclease Cas2 [Arcicella aquatica]|uniref:CRISPR-associated endoribonuclease Cas2 n=1 Tax=Arcicella aquatica TaxID=217141 RepID=A0ABU5QT87_9BACT|nr:CRISPR-associated endonuclease Cas2 [Arcicella aquatica]MEA5260326.1 CRISPR-associated endonuclease Cas2 [Arcicella aquatica]
MLYLAVYDIEDDRLRDKVSQRLIRFGFERIQFSVFVGNLNPTQKQKLDITILKLLEKVDEQKYKYMTMPLAESYVYKADWLGKEKPSWDYHCGNQHTLIL